MWIFLLVENSVKRKKGKMNMRVLLLVLLMSFSVNARSSEHDVSLPSDCGEVLSVRYYFEARLLGVHCKGERSPFLYLTDSKGWSTRKNLVIKSEEVD